MDRLNVEFDLTKVGYISLTKGKIAYYDLNDFDIIRRHRWSCEKSGNQYYAYRKDRNNKTVRMHNDLLKPSIGFIVDHANGNSLDNRRINLRMVSRTINALNTMRYSGYSKTKSGKYVSRIRLRLLNREYRLGPFITREEAIEAYNRKKQELIRNLLNN